MQQPFSPEEELELELQRQERDIHSNLFLINQLIDLFSNENLTWEQIRTEAKPILNKFKQTNPATARELENILTLNERKKALDYCENEKMQLSQSLNDEIRQQKEVNRRINEEKREKFPTDS